MATKVRWIIIRRNGDIDKQESTIEREIPQAGAGVFLRDGKGYGVKGHAFTPHLDCEYHVLVEELPDL